MRLIEFILCTIQYRSLKAYEMIKKEQKRREKESETPFEGTWFFKLQRSVWSLKHYRRCGQKPKEVSETYLNVLETLSNKAEMFQEDRFQVVGMSMRLSGSTLVIDEKWSINQCNSGIYVHRRENADAEWKLVYRTYWLMDDINFIQLLLNAKSLACVAIPTMDRVSEDDSRHLAAEALIY